MCVHTVPSPLRQKFDDKTLCPPCSVQKQIIKLRACQRGIESRGGVFTSKECPHTKDDGLVCAKKRKGHRSWILKWSRAKVRLSNVVDVLEGLRDDEDWGKDVTHDGRREFKLMMNALELWEAEKEELMEVPGVGMAAAGDQSANFEDREGKDSQDTSTQSSTDESGETTELVLAKPNLNNRIDPGPKEKSPTPNSNDEQSKEDPRNIPLPDDDDERSLKFYKSPVKANRSRASWLFHLLGDVQENYRLRTTRQHLFTPPPLPPYPNPIYSIRPIIRHSRSSSSSSRGPPPQSKQHIRFDDRVSIAGGYRGQTLEHGFRTEHSYAESTRPQRNFWRSSPLYKPGTWASQEGQMKVQTSFFRVSWETMEEWIKETFDVDDKDDAEQSKANPKPDTTHIKETERENVSQKQPTKPNLILTPSRSYSTTTYVDVGLQEQLSAVAGMWASLWWLSFLVPVIIAVLDLSFGYLAVSRDG